MIIRLSAKLAKKLKVDYAQPYPLDVNPYLDWSAHLFTAERVQYILVTNTVSLYSFVMYGAGCASDSDFLSRLSSQMKDVLNQDGFELIFRRIIAPAFTEVAFSKALNRSVTGSINELVIHSKYFLTVREMSPFEAGFELNDVLMGFIGHKTPKEAFSEMAISR